MVAFLACITTSSGFAQSAFTQGKHESDKDHDHKGRFFSGGAVSFWSDNKDKTLTLDLCPEIGYLFNDSWGVGMLLGYEYERKEEGTTKTIGNAFKVSPFVRYYYIHKNPFNLYLDGGFGFNFSKEKVGNTSENLSGFEIGIRPREPVSISRKVFASVCVWDLSVTGTTTLWEKNRRWEAKASDSALRPKS